MEPGGVRRGNRRDPNLFDASGPGADPGIENVEREIAAENRTVENSGNYVTIALLDPFTEPPNGISDVSPARIEDMLRGAYVAQEAFNASAQSTGSTGGTGTASSGGRALQVRLVLANEGSQGQGVQDVVGQLERVTAYPGRLLAVTGMGISVQATVDAAHALGSGGASIPMFGAVTTADQFDNATNAREYRNVLDTTAGVADPWMIATYNATVVAWNVISQAAANLGNEPLSQLYALNVTGALDGFYNGYNFAGAAGRFEIRTGGDLMDQSAIPIPLISLSGGGLTPLTK